LARNYIYSATDKALFDALNQAKISNSELRELFVTRGVLVSKDTERVDLAKNFSKYVHDYYDHQKIAASLGTTSRKEKTTFKEISNVLDKDVLIRSAEKLRDLVESNNDLCHVYLSSENVISVKITYETLDYSNSDFKQVSFKEAEIEIEFSGDNVIVRGQDNPHVEEYIENLFSYISNISNCDQLDVEEISLLNISSPTLKTEFFTKFISSLTGHVVEDVTDVYVFKPKKLEDIWKKEQDPYANEYHITKISLKGQGVLVSEELDSMYEKGFYIWKIRWTLKESLPDSDIFEFEAQFSSPEECTGFSYMPKGVIRYKGEGEFNKTKAQLTHKENTSYTKLLENAARQSMKYIQDKALKEGTNESNSI
jgi:hypothetical protein